MGKLELNKKKKEERIEENVKQKYPFADEMLTTIRQEYETENDRKKTLDTKASTFITVNIALLTIFIPLIPFMKLQSFFDESSGIEKSVAIIGLIMLGVSIVLLLASFVILVYAAGISGYRRVQLDSILNLSSNEEQRDVSCVKQTLVAHYHQILRGTIDDEGNYKINTGRADKIQLGIILMVIGYVVLFISTIVLRITVV